MPAHGQLSSGKNLADFLRFADPINIEKKHPLFAVIFGASDQRLTRQKKAPLMALLTHCWIAY